MATETKETLLEKSKVEKPKKAAKKASPKKAVKTIASNENQDELSLLRFITCGSVDDGKSTLIGRLLFDAGQVFDDQLEALDEASAKFGTQGKGRDYALLVDGLSAEREQGITIDVAYRYFRTKKRSFIVADTPGHEQYTRNMATGASTAEVAILLIDARKGVLQQTRRHALIVSMLGVKRVVLAINKMDLIGYDEARYNAIVKDFQTLNHAFNFAEVQAIPISAVNGENIALGSDNMSWYKGESLLNYLENVKTEEETETGFRYPVQWVNRPDLNFRGFSGYVARGSIKPGQTIRVANSGQTSKIERIVTFDGDLDIAQKGQSLTITLEDEIDISRGDIILDANETITPKKVFGAQILWMSQTPLRVEKEYIIKHTAKETNARITRIESSINFETLNSSEATELKMNGIAKVEIALDTPILVDNYQNDRDLGAFILIDRISNETIALGLVENTAKAAEFNAINNFNSLSRQILPNTENPAKLISYGIKWHLLGGLITFILALLVTKNPSASLMLAFLEMAIKPVAQIIQYRILNKTKNDKAAIDDNIDGSGI